MLNWLKEELLDAVRDPEVQYAACLAFFAWAITR